MHLNEQTANMNEQKAELLNFFPECFQFKTLKSLELV